MDKGRNYISALVFCVLFSDDFIVAAFCPVTLLNLFYLHF